MSKTSDISHLHKCHKQSTVVVQFQTEFVSVVIATLLAVSPPSTLPQKTALGAVPKDKYQTVSANMQKVNQTKVN